MKIHNLFILRQKERQIFFRIPHASPLKNTEKTRLKTQDRCVLGYKLAQATSFFGFF
ncbi:hypothetical protein [Hugenholtzia roseola]|uniref:hypothetical protein n=1 Tax=Hugenholtzia roseola TaxID=1002 RepID=UPI00040CF5A7|nr:hypothetical protein [Hugenholtzia roseola]